MSTKWSWTKRIYLKSMCVIIASKTKYSDTGLTNGRHMPLIQKKEGNIFADG